MKKKISSKFPLIFESKFQLPMWKRAGCSEHEFTQTQINAFALWRHFRHEKNIFPDFSGQFLTVDISCINIRENQPCLNISSKNPRPLLVRETIIKIDKFVQMENHKVSLAVMLNLANIIYLFFILISIWIFCMHRY